MAPATKRKPSAGLLRRPGTARAAWGLAVVALVAIGWLEVGWFVTDRADVVCVGQEDGSVTCTAIRYYRYRTRSHVVDGVIGVTVLERDYRDIESGTIIYELRLLRRSGRTRPSLGRSYNSLEAASKEADRLTSVVAAVTPGERVTEHTIEPLSKAGVVALSFGMILVTLFVLVCALLVAVMVAHFLGGLYRSGSRRLPRLPRR